MANDNSSRAARAIRDYFPHISLSEAKRQVSIGNEGGKSLEALCDLVRIEWDVEIGGERNILNQTIGELTMLRDGNALLVRDGVRVNRGTYSGMAERENREWLFLNLPNDPRQILQRYRNRGLEFGTLRWLERFIEEYTPIEEEIRRVLERNEVEIITHSREPAPSPNFWTPTRWLSTRTDPNPCAPTWPSERRTRAPHHHFECSTPPTQIDLPRGQLAPYPTSREQRFLLVTTA